MKIYELISDNLPILRRLHKNGISGNYISYLPIYHDYKRLVAEGNKEVFRRNMEISRNVMEVMEKARKSAGMSF